MSRSFIDNFCILVVMAGIWAIWVSSQLRAIREELKEIREKLDKK